MKENAIENFNKMIHNSWTYEKLTTAEKQNWENVLDSTPTKEAVKGTYQQRWKILQAIYSGFLNALDYKPINWREESEVLF